MKKLFGEFKTFIMRGNIMDMAIGVVIGTAFGAIVTSLVNDIIMPLVGAAVGNVSFTDLCVVVGGTKDAPVMLKYGVFIQTVLNFLIIALCIFLVVEAVNKLMDTARSRKKKEEEAAAPAEPEIPADVQLLTEIRDLLKAEKK